MSYKRIFNREGEFIAERVDEGDKILIYSRFGEYLGEYIRSSNETYDKFGAYVGREDLLNTLIPC